MTGALKSKIAAMIRRMSFMIGEKPPRPTDSEALIQSIGDNLPNGMLYQIVRDRKGGRKFTYVSDAVRRFYGCSPEQAMANAKLIYDNVFEEDIQRLIAEEENAHKSLSKFSTEARVRNPDGGIRWSYFASNPRPLENGSTCWDGIEIDITDRKRMEDALRKSEDRFRLLFENAPMPYQSLDENGNFIEVNKAFLNTLGYTRKELIGRNFGDFLHPDYADHFRENFPKFKAVGEILGVEFEMSKKDGSTILVFFNGKIQRDEAGCFQRTHCVFQDITERRKIEETLRQKVEELDYYFNSSLDLLCIADTGGRFIRLNPEWEKVLGYSLADLEGKMFLDFVHPEDRDATIAAVSRLENQEEVLNFENRYRCKDGSYRWIEWKSKPQGSTIYAAARDVTDRRQAENRRKAQTEMLTAIFESAPYIMMLINREGRIGNINLPGIKFARRKKSELLNLLGGEVFGCLNSFDGLGCGRNPECSECPVRTKVMQTFQTGETFYNADGGLTVRKENRAVQLDLSISTAPVKVEGADMVLLTIADITERKQAENALHALSSRQNALLSAIPDIIMEVDANKAYTWANHAGFAFFGDDVIGRPADFYFEGEQNTYNHVKPLFNGGEDVIYVESWQRRRDGQKRLLAWWCRVLKNDEGEVTGALSTGRDITEHKQAETEMRQFKSIFDNANFGAAIADLNGVLIYVNECHAAMHGYKAEELKGKHLRVLHNDEQMELVNRLLDQLQKEGRFEAQEVGHCRKDGSAFPMLMTGTLGRDEQGNPQYFTATAIDLTEQKVLEAQILQAQKMESVGRLAGGIAHDFNNMLSVILGHVNMLLEDTHPDARLRGALETIQHAGQRSAALTSQILAFARKQIIFPKIIDLNAAVGNMIRMLRRIVGENIEVIWTPGADLWPIRIDPSQVDQILLNLGANARDAILGVGKLAIETANVSVDESYINGHAEFVPGDYVMLTASDDGQGMDRETLDHVFEPFFTTKEVGKGIGMGMATVYGIVKQNKGFIYAYSEPGKGTAFKIYLPRQTGDDAPVTKAIPQAPVPTEWETVLVVEDDPSILDLCRMMLRKLGHPVLAAATPTEAIRLAQEHEGEIHLLMSDVIMPEMNGPALARRIFPLRPEIKCLFMSGYTADIIARQGLLEKGMNFIEKPFTRKDLDAKIRGIFKDR